MENLLVALIVIGVGIVSCFFGWRFFKLVLALWGFLLGGSIGLTIVGPEAATLSLLIAFGIGGLIGAGLAVALYVIGVFIAGAMFGAGVGGGIAALLNLEGILLLILVVIGLIVGGALAVWLQKLFIILVTAFSGAASIIAGVLLVLTGEQFTSVEGILAGASPIYVLVLLVLAVWGMFVQYRMSGEQVDRL